MVYVGRMKTYKRRLQRRATRKRGGACPPHMPAKVCQTWLLKQARRRMPHNLQRNIKQLASHMSFKRKPLNERVQILKNKWKNYVNSRQSLSSGQSNELDNNNIKDIHTFNKNEI